MSATGKIFRIESAINELWNGKKRKSGDSIRLPLPS